MIHDIQDYWRHLQSQEPGSPDLPSPRVCRLLNHVFEGWRHKPLWLSEEDTGTVFDGLDESAREELARAPVVVRKAKAISRALELLTDRQIARRTGTMRLDADELIAGTMPPYAVGTGKELVGYLTDDEALAAAANFLNDRSPFGHVVPDHERVVRYGIEGLIEQAATSANAESAAFFEAVRIALEGVLAFADRWADYAVETAERLREDDPRRAEMLELAARLRHVPRKPPTSFLEAVQAVYLTHCALHATGETVPLGRLDQILWPFLEKDIAEKKLDLAGAQEIVDCFFLKLDERVVLSHDHLEDHFTFADGALLGTKGGSNFDQGGLANQWMQQLTIGGVVADEAPEQVDATNPLTYLFLEAARRLPVNSPTLDLRLHKQSPPELVRAAARALLSGGAHPVLLNDDRIIPKLHKATGGNVALASARNYACDGCYETLYAGETEFSFGMISAPGMVERALNRGASFGGAGPLHLRGLKDSFRTAPAEGIADFEELWSILLRHLELAALRFMGGILTFYGEKATVAPSPLLSALIGGCFEKGRDFADGGARYRLISPLLTGISTAADSLYVLKHLVYTGEPDVRPDELVTCLRRNWGSVPWSVGAHVPDARIAEIRDLVWSQPKFGTGAVEVDELAWRLIDDFHTIVMKARTHPIHEAKWARLRETYGSDFDILFAPGVGTFEQYLFGGGFVGPTPDGRAGGEPIASDFSAAPVRRDVDPHVERADRLGHVREVPLLDALASFADPRVDWLSDGAPADLNIPEDFPEDELVEAITRFKDGEAGNLLTFTVANPETFRDAMRAPDEHELVRVRMGGWTEFFITLFPEHQHQHIRRPLYVARRNDD